MRTVHANSSAALGSVPARSLQTPAQSGPLRLTVLADVALQRTDVARPPTGVLQFARHTLAQRGGNASPERLRAVSLLESDLATWVVAIVARLLILAHEVLDSVAVERRQTTRHGESPYTRSAAARSGSIV